MYHSFSTLNYDFISRSLGEFFQGLHPANVVANEIFALLETLTLNIHDLTL